ncbi:uncharacterized protein [Watersipora subatra]|uniref:uncharacterized protein n=1 Tax=Watersipora subatra TaxID=2589382 RepID=UPI00355C1CC3
MTSFRAKTIDEPRFNPNFKVQGQVYHLIGSLLSIPEHERRFNAPVIDEVAVQIVGQQFEKWGIVLQLRSNELQRISETHRAYDALQYPLMFWPEQVDCVISVEKPNRVEDPQLFEIVTKHMVHGPCGQLNSGSPCMKDGTCTKKYLKALIKDTVTGIDGAYDITLDNRWIVPYCPLLSKVFDAHINVNFGNSVKSIKYICKYVNKGSDQAVFGLERDGAQVDEVAHYESERYISANEAMWGIFSFPIQSRHLTVQHLSVHLENGQRVYFTEHLRTVQGHVCATFHEACRRLGLLEDDAQWREALEEAATAQSPARLRKLFAIMLSTCQLSGPLQLWQKFKEHLVENTLFHEQQLLQDQQLQVTDGMFNIALIFIEDQVLEVINNNLSVYELPRPVRVEQTVVCREILRETAYDREELRRHVETNEPLLLKKKRGAYHTVLEKIEQSSGGMVFLHAPGETGKTFVTNLILAKVRECGKVALAVASSGIAATLLPGGRNVHSALKLPLNLARTKNPVCIIKNNRRTAQLLQRCILVVWDECTMLHKLAFEALNLTLKGLLGNNRLFGGVTLLLSRDFHQTLPVIQRGTPADEINECIKSSFLWPSVV